MIRVKVPATSANLGVGFDCMGMALTIGGVFTFDFARTGIMISGCPKEYQNTDNLVLHAFFAPCVHGGCRCRTCSLQIDTPIPVARGLGSSASCIVPECWGPWL